jgi:cell division inhibitor SepF
MAGTMRRMGIYLGLVEDDDARGYGRYDARQSDQHDPDRRYGRYADDDRYAASDPRYADGDGRYAEDDYDGAYDDGYAPAYGKGRDRGYADDEPATERPAAEPVGVRRVSPRPLGLAPAAGASAARLGGAAAGGAAGTSGSAGLAVRQVAPEPVAAAPAPEPAPAPAPAPQPYRITTLHPRTYNEARVIGERFRDGLPVIMNLTEMDDADAKRLVDFAAGLSFGLRGSIERVTAKVFLLSPQNVDVTAEDKARIREGGFFNQS